MSMFGFRMNGQYKGKIRAESELQAAQDGMRCMGVGECEQIDILEMRANGDIDITTYEEVYTDWLHFWLYRKKIFREE